MTDLTIEDIKTGKVKARNEWEVRILATDLQGHYPVCFAATNKDNTVEVILRATAEGKCSTTIGGENIYDLVRIPKPYYFNVYTYKTGSPAKGIFFDDLEALAEATRRMADRNRANAKCTQAFRYLDGDITKVEQGEHE